MKFFRFLDRLMVHIYALAALGIVLVFLADTVAYDRAMFAVAQVQGQALLIIASELHGTAL